MTEFARDAYNNHTLNERVSASAKLCRSELRACPSTPFFATTIAIWDGVYLEVEIHVTSHEISRNFAINLKSN